MSDNKDKPANDIDALVEHLHLGQVRYREFGTPRSAVAAPPVAKPAVVPAGAAPAPAAPVSVPLARTPVAPPVADEEAKGLRSVTAASPLAFTFERLRRQAIGAPLRKPYLALNLPERHAWKPSAAPAPRQRLLATIFSELEAPAPARLLKQS